MYSVNVDELLNPETFRHGPFEVLWNQDDWIPHKRSGDPVAYSQAEWRRRTFLQWLLRYRKWRIDMRLAPPEGVDLYAWGTNLGAALGVPFHDGVEDSDKAVWLPMTTWARHAGQALASASKPLRDLEGHNIEVAQMQVRVEEVRA